MKKVGLIILCLFLCSCTDGNIRNDIKIDDIYTTSSKIEASVESSKKDLQYKLYYNNAMLANGEVNGKVVITNLKKDSNYKLIIYNHEISKTKMIKTDDTVVLRFGGDTTMNSVMSGYITQYGTSYPWNDVSYLTQGADYTILNLETTFSNRGIEYNKDGFKDRSNPQYLEGYVNAGVDMLTLANENILKYGADAFNDTLDNLKASKIKYVGAGKTYEEASKVKYVTINDTKIGFLNASSIIPDNSWIATDTSLGVMPLTTEYYDRLYAIIDEANQKCDTLVLLLNWGTEYYDYPSSSQISLAHSFINKGVDLIIGSHSSTLQGVEYYNEGQIFYSIGNFIDSGNTEDTLLTGLFEVEMDKEGLIASRVYPVYINNCKANLLKDNDTKYKKITTSLNTRSKSFETKVSSDGIITKK